MSNKSKKEKSFLQTLAWNISGNFVLKGVSFFTIPIFTRLLATSDYGQVAVYSTWASLFTIFVGLQIEGSIGNARVKYGDSKMWGYLSSILTIPIILFLGLLVVAIAFNQGISDILKIRSDLVILLVIQAFASFCISFYISKLVFFKQAEYNSILSLLISVCSIILSLVFLFLFKEQKYAARIYGNAIPVIIAGIVIVIYVYLKGKEKYNIEYWKYCLGLTLPLILHSAGHLILAQSDRVMLQQIKGETVTGIYSFAYNIALVFQIIFSSFNISWVPFYYEYKRDNQTQAIITRSKNYVIVITIIAIGFIMLAPEVYKLMSPPDYWPGIPLIPLIAAAYYLNFLYLFPVNFEFFYGKTKIISMATIIAAAINIIGNFLLIPSFGGVGAAIATLISYFFLFVFHEFIARIIIKEHYEYKMVFYVIGLMAVVVASVLFYLIQNLWILRWCVGIVLGGYLVWRIKKTKTII